MGLSKGPWVQVYPVQQQAMNICVCVCVYIYIYIYVIIYRERETERERERHRVDQYAESPMLLVTQLLEIEIHKGVQEFGIAASDFGVARMCYPTPRTLN